MIEIRTARQRRAGRRPLRRSCWPGRPSPRGNSPRRSPASDLSGAARRSWPFVRVDDKKIRIREKVYNPDVVLVLDPTLLDIVDVSEGLKEGGTVVVNTAKARTS